LCQIKNVKPPGTNSPPVEDSGDGSELKEAHWPA